MTGHSFLSGFASCPQRYGIIVSGIVIPHLSHHQYMYTLLAWGELLHFYYTTNIISVKLHLSYLTLDRGFEILTNFSRDSHIVEVSCTFPASYGLNCWIFYTTGCCCGGSTDPKTVTHVKFNQLDIGSDVFVQQNEVVWGGLLSEEEWIRCCSPNCKVCSYCCHWAELITSLSHIDCNAMTKGIGLWSVNLYLYHGCLPWIINGYVTLA